MLAQSFSFCLLAAALAAPVTVDVSKVKQVAGGVMTIPLPDEAAGEIVRLQLPLHELYDAASGSIVKQLKVTNWTAPDIEGIQCTCGVHDDEVVVFKSVAECDQTLSLTLSDKTLAALSCGDQLILIDYYRN